MAGYVEADSFPIPTEEELEQATQQVNDIIKKSPWQEVSAPPSPDPSTPSVLTDKDALDEVRQFIQSSSTENIREALYQFLQANPNLMPRFLDSVEREKKTPRSARIDWNHVDGFSGRDWTSEFSKLITELDVTSRPWQTRLYSLSSDFFHAASLYGQVIISELTVPVPLKSIQPVNVGGIAGGRKYIVDNILFKFASDSQLHDAADTWMYGGDEKRDDLAMKSAGIEMRNQQAALGLGHVTIHFPLMCVIDYKGYRLVASSIVPIDASTLVYGSADGGHTIHKRNPDLNELMAQLGQRLNLQEHRVGTRITGKTLYMPGDIEVHHGKDGYYYMLDLARLMPPEAPPVNPQGQIPSQIYRRIFYQTLRPELVYNYKVPLSSDAFSAWSSCEMNRREHDRAVRECTEHLRHTLIPQLAEGLDQNKLGVISVIPDQDQWREFPEGKLRFLDEMLELGHVLHFYGINVRHLGLVRRASRVEAVQSLILAQCVTRTMKNMFRDEMRRLLAQSQGSPTDIPLRDAVLTTYRKIHLGGHSSTQEEQETSKAYWHDVFTKVQWQFEGCFSEEEITEIDRIGLRSFLRGKVDWRLILYRFFNLAQVQLSPQAMHELLQPGQDQQDHVEFQLVRSDVEQFIPRIRKPFPALMASSMLLAEEAQNSSQSNAERLMRLATALMHKAHEAVPLSVRVNALLYQLYWKLSDLCEDVHDKLKARFCTLRHLEMVLVANEKDEIFSEEEIQQVRSRFFALLESTLEWCKDWELPRTNLEAVLKRNLAEAEKRTVFDIPLTSGDSFRYPPVVQRKDSDLSQ